MNKLVELLVDERALMTLDFEQFINMLADVYRECPRKRENIIEVLKRMSEYEYINIEDAMRFAMRVVVERLEDKHYKQIIKYQVHEVASIIKVHEDTVAVKISRSDACPYTRHLYDKYNGHKFAVPSECNEHNG